MIQSLSTEARTIADLLSAAAVGATVSYADMSRALGVPIQQKRYILLRALAVANRESGAIYGAVRGVGYQRLAPQDAHILGAHARGRIRSTAKRAATHMTAALATANDLPDAAKRKAFAEINALSLLRHLASDKKVEAAAGEPKAEPVGVVMRRFAEAIGVNS